MKSDIQLYFVNLTSSITKPQKTKKWGRKTMNPPSSRSIPIGSYLPLSKALLERDLQPRMLIVAPQHTPVVA